MSQKKTWYGRCALMLLMVTLLFSGSAPQWGWAQEEIEISLDSPSFDPDENDEGELPELGDPEGETPPPEIGGEPGDEPEPVDPPVVPEQPDQEDENEDEDAEPQPELVPGTDTETDDDEDEPVPVPVPVPVASQVNSNLDATQGAMDEHEGESDDESDTEGMDEMGIMAADIVPFGAPIPVTVSHHDMSDGHMFNSEEHTYVEAGGDFQPEDIHMGQFIAVYYTVNGDDDSTYSIATPIKDVTTPIHVRIYYTLNGILSLKLPAGDWSFRVDEDTDKKVVSPNYQFINYSNFEVKATLYAVSPDRDNTVVMKKNATNNMEIDLQIVPPDDVANNAFNKGATGICPNTEDNTVFGTMGIRGSSTSVGTLTLTGNYVGALPEGNPYRPGFTITIKFERAS